MDGYASHLQLLTRYAMMAKRGQRIVEMGCGFYSSPVLSEICKAKGVQYEVFYQDEAWKKKVEPKVQAKWHHVPDWSKFNPPPAFMTLLDNEELVVNRYKQLAKLLPINKFVVVHDWKTYTNRPVDLSVYKPVIIDQLTPGTAVLAGAGRKTKLPDAPTGYKRPRPKTLRTAVCCVYRPGGDFDEHWRRYIKELYLSCKRNISVSVPWDFVAICPQDPKIAGVLWEPMQSDLPRWHCKFEMFREEIWDGYTQVLFMDLDTIVVEDISAMMVMKTKFAFIRDLYHAHRPATGVMMFDPTGLRFLYEKALDAGLTASVDDARYVSLWLEEAGIKWDYLQDYFGIASYKADVRGSKSSNLKSYEGKGQIPAGTHIVCFHGRPRPHQVNWQLPEIDKLDIKFGKLPTTEFEGQTVYIIGGGPSLKGMDERLNALQGPVLAVNDAYKFQSATHLYFGDDMWYHHHKKDLRRFRSKIFTTSNISARGIVNLRKSTDPISTDPGALAFNLNSGYAAINLALLCGAKSIILLGFDMCRDEEGDTNWHENIRYVTEDTYVGFISRSQSLKTAIGRHFPKVEILNANMASKLDAFPKVPFDLVVPASSCD
jgi:hypothetical protein